jgi:hypothetical protein
MKDKELDRERVHKTWLMAHFAVQNEQKNKLYLI